MTAHDHDVAQPRTEWFRRVTGRLLALAPQMLPLEAVRRAMDAFPDSQHDDPEQVARGLLESGPPAATDPADDPAAAA